MSPTEHNTYLIYNNIKTSKDMKKTYISPKMEVEVIELESMIAASLDFKNETKVKDLDKELLGKDRDDSDWGGLW